MNTNRVSVVIVILIYLTCLFFFLEAMGKDIAIDYTSTSQSIGGTVKFLGMEVGINGGFLSNIIVSIATLPIWFNAIFIVIPSIILAVFTIMMFIPTIPSG